MNESNILFVLQHGFACNNSYWDNLKDELAKKGNYEFIYLSDLSSHQAQRSGNAENKIIVGIGHSIGFVKLINAHNENKIALNAIVGIQSFYNFCGYSSALCSNREESLEKMQSAFEKNPQLMRKNFLKACDINLPSSFFNSEEIIGDFKMLFSDINDKQTPINKIIITSSMDPIVPEEIIHDNFMNQCKIYCLQHNMHNLGLEKAPEVSQIIDNFVSA